VLCNFCNLLDGAGRVVYTPALQGAVAAGTFDEWMVIQRAAGSTHTAFGDFVGGPAYPGVHWSNPEWSQDPAAIREFVLSVLNTESADGLGFRPIIFLDGGAANPSPRIQQNWPVIATALDGLLPYVLLVIAWEPVVGDWTSNQYSQALELAHSLFPGAYLAGHGSPTRWVGSSNPPEPDDPWQGAESDFFKTHGGQYLSGWFYQTPHGQALYEDCSPDDDACWLNRWNDGVVRLGGGYHGWRVMDVNLFETVAYEFFRGQATSQQAREVASRGQVVAQSANVRVGFGNGLPL
jgi:hypothetical protein